MIRKVLFVVCMMLAAWSIGVWLTLWGWNA